jgi:hypothetical protein
VIGRCRVSRYICMYSHPIAHYATHAHLNRTPQHAHPHTTTPQGGTAVAFKVKTTQPKRYLVKPNQGVLEPGKADRIQIQIVPKDRL